MDPILPRSQSFTETFFFRSSFVCEALARHVSWWWVGLPVYKKCKSHKLKMFKKEIQFRIGSQAAPPVRGLIVHHSAARTKSQLRLRFGVFVLNRYILNRRLRHLCNNANKNAALRLTGSLTPEKKCRSTTTTGLLFKKSASCVRCDGNTRADVRNRLIDIILLRWRKERRPRIFRLVY